MTLKGSGTASMMFKDEDSRNMCAHLWHKLRILDQGGSMNILSIEDAHEDLFLPNLPSPLAARVASEAFEIPTACKNVDMNEAYERSKRLRMLEASFITEKRMGRPCGHGRWSYEMRNKLLDLGHCTYCGFTGHRQ